MADTEPVPDTGSAEPVLVGAVPVPLEFVETFADQPFSPGRIAIRIVPVETPHGGETPPADPPETATEGGR